MSWCFSNFLKSFINSAPCFMVGVHCVHGARCSYHYMGYDTLAKESLCARKSIVSRVEEEKKMCSLRKSTDENRNPFGHSFHSHLTLAVEQLKLKYVLLPACVCFVSYEREIAVFIARCRSLHFLIAFCVKVFAFYSSSFTHCRVLHSSLTFTSSICQGSIYFFPSANSERSAASCCTFLFSSSCLQHHYNECKKFRKKVRAKKRSTEELLYNVACAWAMSIEHEHVVIVVP